MHNIHGMPWDYLKYRMFTPQMNKGIMLHVEKKKKKKESIISDSTPIIINVLRLVLVERNSKEAHIKIHPLICDMRFIFDISQGGLIEISFKSFSEDSHFEVQIYASK